MKTPNQKWLDKLSGSVHQFWEYHGPCKHINIQCFWSEKEKSWIVNIAPVYQEVYGGDADGKRVWTGYIFDFGEFSKIPGLYITNTAVASKCKECCPNPRFMAKGKWYGKPIYLNVFLEPIDKTDTVEVIDTIKKEIRETHIKSETDTETGAETTPES